MIIQRLKYEQDSWTTQNETAPEHNPQLILFFGSKSSLSTPQCYNSLRTMYPDSLLVGCSTSGEILGEHVYDDTAVATAIEFEHTSVQLESVSIENSELSFAKGKELSNKLRKKGLKNVLILSDGQNVNGTALIKGLQENFTNDEVVTGGLAGDGADFNETLVSANCPPTPGLIAALGFYGEGHQIGYGSAGGWDSFGPNRLVTKSKANVLYELDGKPALELYKTYLGDEAKNLPSSALLFPLMIRKNEKEEEGTVRTILAVNEEDNSMTFAGDIPEGYVAQLMMANFDSLVDGADNAAQYSIQNIIQGNDHEKLAILISCVGRKLVLGSKTEDEVEATQSKFDNHTTQIGFYSYGEISPQFGSGSCELHNQTMTITLISE